MKLLKPSKRHVRRDWSVLHWYCLTPYIVITPTGRLSSAKYINRGMLEDYYR